MGYTIRGKGWYRIVGIFTGKQAVTGISPFNLSRAGTLLNLDGQ